MLGDDYSKDIALAIGFAVADPVAAQAGMGIEKGDETSEEVLATRIANGLIGKIIRGVPAKPATAATFEAPATTFGGFGERRQPKEYAKTTNAPATFMGANPTGDTEEVVHE